MSASACHKSPAVMIDRQPILGRCRLAARWARFFGRSMVSQQYDFCVNALRAELNLVRLTLADCVTPRAGVECNICGWRGRQFYPNVGPGYDEQNMLCPSCRTLDRHRSLVVALIDATTFFSPGKRIIEVAPMRSFQSLCQAQGWMHYVSFDLSRFAMERGDLTQMRYEGDSADYFLCFHVLEHVKEERKAISEIRRVLKPGGTAVFQVPVDWELERTYEYERPDPREVDHVRRYGRDFGERLASCGFEMQVWRAADRVPQEVCDRYRLSQEPIFLARKV